MQQRLAMIRKDGGSFVLAGDPDWPSPDNSTRQMLPRLLEAGWRIVSIHMTASAAVNDDQVLGVAILERE
jgi:hypothetical protein